MYSRNTMSRRRLLAGSAGVAALAVTPWLASPASATSTGNRRINASGVRLRTGPGTTHGVIASLALGTHVLFLNDAGSANGYTWAKVRENSSGREGFVAVKYLSPLSSGGEWAARSMVHVNTAGGGGANLRSSASISAGVVALVANGTTGSILEGPMNASGYT